MFFRLQRGAASVYRSSSAPHPHLYTAFTCPAYTNASSTPPSRARTQAGQPRMFALYAPRPNQPKTLAHQSSLPRLPVPKLSDSLAKYLKSLKPILYERSRLEKVEDADAFVSAELGKRQEWIQNFDSISGLGRTLQERLIDADRAQPSNWLDDAYWLNVAYHSWRVPLPINSNWWLLCAHDTDVPKSVTDSRPTQGEYTNWQVRRAAVMAARLMDFKERLDRQELLPDSSRAGPFCMHQYTRVFGVTRIPAVPNDYFKHVPAISPHSHAIVIVKDQIFSLNMKDENGKVKSKDDIEKALWLIIKDVRIGNTERSLPIGVLTGANRDTWTKTREHLISLSPNNRANLTVIENGLFVLALDDWTRIHPSAHVSSLASELIPPSQAHLQTPSAGAEINASLELDGHVLNSCSGLNGHNRWFDKCMTINVESNSRASVMGEHSPCDALIPSIIADYVLAEGMGRPKGPSMTTDDEGNDAGPDAATLESAERDIQRLNWVTDAKISDAIDAAESEIKALVEDSEGLMLWYDDYGTEWIKKVGKQSPDAYIQMAMQLAYRRMHGQGCPTYETASTRLFLHGRTDVIRTYSEDSQKWVEAMIAGGDSGSSAFVQEAKKLYDLLAKAIAAHNTYTREASTGKGIDRHLLGLRLNLKAGESHPLLEEPLIAESQTWKLSTSGLSAGDRFYGTGFGATDPDGYGINYLAGAKVIKFGIESKWSSKVASTHKYRLEIIKAMRDMRKICEHGQDASASTGDTTKGKL